MKKDIFVGKYQISKKACLPAKQGFTLIELMIVIAIIGILAGVVLVSMQSAVDRAKRASAITTAASVLPELVTCGDDDGNISAYTGAGPSGSSICSATGHGVKWPSLGNTGWTFNAPADSFPISSTYFFTLVHDTEADIICSLDTNGCE